MRSNTITLNHEQLRRYQQDRVLGLLLPDYNPRIGYAAWDEVKERMYLSETSPRHWEYRLEHYAPGQEI